MSELERVRLGAAVEQGEEPLLERRRWGTVGAHAEPDLRAAYFDNLGFLSGRVATTIKRLQ